MLRRGVPSSAGPEWTGFSEGVRWVPRESFTPPAAAISVSSADTDHPRGTVMIDSPPEKDLAVVWVFDLD